MMAKKGRLYKPHFKRPPHLLKILCGVERNAINDGGTFPVIHMTHEDVMRLYEYSKLMRAKGYHWIQVEKYKKKTKGNIKYTLALAIPDKREIIHGSTFDKLIVPFDKTRNINELEPWHGREFNHPTKGFKLILKKGETEYKDFEDEKPKKPKSKKEEPRAMKSFDQLLAASIAKEEEEKNQAPVEEPQEKPLDFDENDDKNYE